MRDAVQHTLRAVLGPSLLALLACALGAQRTWVVDELNRPGTDFLNLPEAVTAAASGDTIRVRTDDHVWPHYFAPRIDGKGLQIVGDPAGPAWVVGSTWIRNVPRDRRVVLAHLEHGTPRVLASIGFSPPPPAWPWSYIMIRDNQGPVILDHIELGDQPNTVFPTPPWMWRNELVVVSHCTWRILAHVELRETRLMVDSSLIERLPLLNAEYGTTIDLDQGCTLWLSNTTVRGSDAPASNPLGASTALEVCNASEVYVGANTVLEAGRLAGGAYTLVVNRGPCWPESGTARLYRDPTATFLGLYPNYEVLDLPGPVAAVRSTTSPGNLHVHQHAAPSAPVLLAAAQLVPVPAVNLPAPVWLDLQRTLMVDFGFAPATGLRTRTFAIPPGLPPGVVLGFQGFELLPSGEVLTSNALHVGVW